MSELPITERFKRYADVVLTLEQCRAAEYLERQGQRAFVDFGHENAVWQAREIQRANRSKAARKAWRKRRKAL